jgi:3-oxoacyl-[acyl-carrier-protein] synthase-3
MNAHIKGISYYLPGDALTNDIISERFPEWSVEKISSKVGISERRIAGEKEFVSDLAVKAAENLFRDHSISPSVIDYIILCTQSPDYSLPTTACIVQDRLGVPVTAGAIDFNQGCSGFVYGLSLAKGLIASGDFNNILLITAETYSKYIHPEDKANLTIFGDAAAAILVSSEETAVSIGRFSVGTDGRGAENLIVKRGGARFPKTNDTGFTDDADLANFNGNYLYMNGAEIFNFTIESVPNLIRETLQKNSLKEDDIDLYIFHQANQFMLHHLRKKLKISEERFYIFMDKCGNTVSSTIPIAITQALSEGRIKPGNKVLIAGFGVGYSWAGTVIQF